ncbi:MAG TPA: hypothetical protein PK165_04715 [bacterium]|nr:hypothetical protein [Victivallales bacterium]HPO52114.1 hypothetical protein [bacterium]
MMKHCIIIALILVIGIAGTGCLTCKKGIIEENKRIKEKPYLKLMSPAGGETWREGSSYEIKWKSSGVKKISIQVFTGGHDRGHLAFGIDAKNGKYLWKIPEGFITGFGISKSDAVRIRIYDIENPDVFDRNETCFTVEGTQQ